LPWLCAAAGVFAFALRAPSVGINRFAAIPLVLSLGAGFLFFGDKIICNHPEPYKGTAWFFKPDSGAKLEATAWTTIAKIDIFFPIPCAIYGPALISGVHAIFSSLPRTTLRRQ
jgi:hypothetical protein